MKITLHSPKIYLFASLFIFLTTVTTAQEIASFSSIQNSACSGIINTDPNLTAIGICRGPGIIENAGGTYNSRLWTFIDAIDPDDYYEWTITPNAGYQLNLNTLDIRYDKSGTGPQRAIIRVDTGGGFTTIYSDNNVNQNGESIFGIDLSMFSEITNTVTFRIYAYYALNSNGTFDIEELVAGTNKGIIINGNVELIPCPVVRTWDGAAWDVLPTINEGAIIDGDYFMDATNPSFSACSLTVNAGATLTISDNYYVEIENDILVDGNINVRPRGSVVQNDDLAAVTINPGGTIEVTKSTANINNWYEYTYWSSPVASESIGNALFQAQPNRRFKFDGSRFLDNEAETNNNNTPIVGAQDDVDDNGDDWTLVNGAQVMEPGVGYAATHSPLAFILGPGSYDYIFAGPFNNGIYTVPIFRNDATLLDNNWNFIGNPYPSAISVVDFLDANAGLVNEAVTGGAIDGAIYLWSQNTPPSDITNGNEQLNFAQADYAIINRVDGLAGGDGNNPGLFIPSGQGFFVSMSNAAPATNVSGTIWTADVIFNNSMRVTNANDQFFRTASTDLNNKIWIDLTSDNGVFNQVLIGYVDGATNGFDGAAFDAPRNLSTGANSILYSIIENNDKKFAIQGRDPNSLTEDEVIPLGFYTSINVPTLYTLSIAQMEGAFFEEHPVYIKDQLLNELHLLSQSDYVFTSETGEFNDRFEIVYSASALSTDEVSILPSQLIISELNNGEVKISINKNLTITKVEILDLLGRIIYQFKGNTSTEIYDLSKLSKSTYLARVTLSNGQTLTKKAIKR